MHVHVDMRQTAGNYPPIKPVFEADLGLATLLQLPVPVLVLNSERFTVLANKAAKRVLRSPQNASRRCGQDPVPTTIIGTHAAHLGLFQDDGLQTSKLNWDIILGTKVEGSSPKAHEIFVDLGHNGFVQKFSITASPIILDGEIYFSIYFSPSYVPVITDQATETKSSIPTDRQPICGHESIVPAPVVASLTCLLKLAQVEQLRAAVFDSVETVAFLFSADEKTVVMNEAAKKFIGPAAVAAIGYDGAMFIPYFPVYDPEFSEALDIDSFPALHIVRRRENLPARRLGFVHKGTGTKMVMHISGECLYDPATGEFVGALLRLRELQNVSQYLAQRRGDLIKSHETICNVMPHLVWATAPDGKCDYFSDRWYEFTGMSIEESLGYGYHAAVHPEDLPNLLEKWEIGLKTAEDYEIEARYRRHDGVYKWALVRAVPLKDDTGNVMAWYGTNTDIHESVMSRIRNHRIKEQIYAVLAHAEVNLFAIDLSGNFTMAEGAMYRDVGSAGKHNMDILSGMNLFDITNGLKAKGIQPFITRVRDIIDGRAKDSEAVDVVDGRSYRTRLIAELGHNEEDGAQEPTIHGVLGLSINVSDIEARAALEVENARLQMEEQAAQEASRMKSQFLANMSHEMRTPLAGVIGLTDLLADTHLNDEQIEFVKSIKLSSKILLAVVNDVLDFSKVESGRLDIEAVDFSLHDNVTDLYRLLIPSAMQKGLSLEYSGSIPKDLHVLGDPSRIRQILLNILTNALKFTKKGSVKLTSKITPIFDGQDELKATFIVEDTGIGIEKHVLDRLFQPFRQGDSSTARLYGGTGLGLAISKNLARLMDGTLELTSSPGSGSTATFSLPLRLSRGPHVTPQPPESPIMFARRISRSMIDIIDSQKMAIESAGDLHSKNLSSVTEVPMTTNALPNLIAETRELSADERSRIHILVVEDNSINQTIALKTIEKLGFTATAVWNGAEALSYIATCIGTDEPDGMMSSDPPPTPMASCTQVTTNMGVDASLSDASKTPTVEIPAGLRLPSIILMDVQMPVMDGYSATKALRTENPFKENEALQKVPIIALTASAIQGDMEKCIEAGMNDYLAKPVRGRILEGMLVKWGVKGRA